MKKYIIIEADTNDGDYISKKTEITDNELELIKPIIEAIKNFEPYVGTKPDYWKSKHYHNYPVGECYREDLGELSIYELYGHLENFDIFDDMVPFDEYGIHTISSIELLEVINEIKLL